MTHGAPPTSCANRSMCLTIRRHSIRGRLQPGLRTGRTNTRARIPCRACGVDLSCWGRPRAELLADEERAASCRVKSRILARPRLQVIVPIRCRRRCGISGATQSGSKRLHDEICRHLPGERRTERIVHAIIYIRGERETNGSSRLVIPCQPGPATGCL